MIKIVLGLAVSRDLLQNNDGADTSKTKIRFAARSIPNQDQHCSLQDCQDSCKFCFPRKHTNVSTFH